jgi:hypothetical protein
MRKSFVPASAALLFAGAAMWMPQRQLEAQEEGIQWHSSYREALAEAKRTGKPIFLEYRCEP